MVNEGDVITWLREKSDRDFFDFVYRAAEGRGPDPRDSGWLESHVVIGLALRDRMAADSQEPWRIELVSLPSANAATSPDDFLCESGRHCDHALVSWAKRIRCPVCGSDTHAT